MQSINCKGTSTIGLQQVTACAACKHQRKKCTQTCILAPYFHAEMTKEFQAVHNAFGVSNVKKMVKSVNEEERERVVDSLIWEACCRQKDPILGPYAEYKKVFDELKIYQIQKNNQLLQMETNYYNYKPNLSSLVRWNNVSTNNSNGLCGGSVNNNNGLNYNYHYNGNFLTDQINPFNYSSNYVQISTDAEKLMRQEKSSVDSVLLLQQHQQNSVNGFNHKYYLSDQYNELNQKRIESTVRESGS